MKTCPSPSARVTVGSSTGTTGWFASGLEAISCSAEDQRKLLGNRAAVLVPPVPGPRAHCGRRLRKEGDE